MKNTRIKNLITLAALAFAAGGVPQALALPPNNWTLVGPSAGGGYIIVGSGALNLGPLGPSSFPVHLSTNGSDSITLNAGSTATSGGAETIDIETTNNTLNNLGTIINTNNGGGAVLLDNNGNILNNQGTINGNYEGVQAYGNGITLNNSGTIYAVYYAVDIEGNNSILNNKSTITSNYDTIYLIGANDTINNSGLITATGTGGEWAIYTDNTASHLTVNNSGVITASGSYGYYDNSGSYNTINNQGTISGSYAGIYLNEAPHDTINNWGTISASSSSSYGISNSGDYLTVNNRGLIQGGEYGIDQEASFAVVNNWGTITSPNGYGIYSDGEGNTYNNWGTIYGGDQGFSLNESHNLLNNWGTISSSSEGIFLNEPFNIINNYGLVTGGNFALYINDSNNVINNYGTMSTPATGENAIFFENSYHNDTLNNWGLVTANGGSVAILIDGATNTLNLDGHSSVIGRITVNGAGNVVNLNFTGLSPATIAALNAQLIPQGVNSGNPTSAAFTVRGVTYNIDPAVINTDLSSYQAQAKTPNQTVIAKNLDGLTTNPAPGTTLFNLLNAIDASGNVPGALDAISPIKYAVYGDLAIQNTTALVQGIDRRLNNLSDGSESVDTTSLGGDNTVAAVVTGDPSKDGSKESKQVVQPEPQQNRWGFFASGDGLFFRGSAGNSLQDGKSNTAGTIAGVDGKVGEHAVIGALFSYNNSAVDLGNDGSHATIESYTGGIYGSYHQDGFYANSLAAYTRNNYTSSSNVLFPGFATTGNGSTHGNQYSANIDGGYDFNLTNRLTVGPIAGVQYVHLDVDGFNEAGGVLALGDQSLNSLQSRVGGKAQYKIATTATSSTGIEVYAAWQHEYLNDSRGISASFQGSGLAPFAVQTGSPERDAGVVGASLNFSFHNRLTLFADYELQIWNQSNFNQSINGGAKISF